VKGRILELRSRGHILEQVARILNEQNRVPLKGRQFTERSVRSLLRGLNERKQLGPRRYLADLLERMERTHCKENPGEPFARPLLPTLATMLSEAGYETPRGGGSADCTCRQALRSASSPERESRPALPAAGYRPLDGRPL
jgi:hypothetical protein